IPPPFRAPPTTFTTFPGWCRAHIRTMLDRTMLHLTIICAEGLDQVAPRGFTSAVVVPVAAASPRELEAALLTGFAPEYHPRPPFWARANAAANVRTRHHPEWNTADPAPRLTLKSGTALDLPAEGPCALVATGHGDSFGALHARGFEIPKQI